jgi:hypothetical protein
MSHYTIADHKVFTFRQERSQTQTLRDEQDQAYHVSLQADKEKVINTTLYIAHVMILNLNL